MTRDDIIRMARESGECQLSDRQFVLHGLEQITRFAALVAAAEREACAKVCDEVEASPEYKAVVKLCAAAIRARGDK